MPARIVLLDDPVDWIMFANAHSLRQRYPGAQINHIDNCNLAGLGHADPLLLVAHSNQNIVGVQTTLAGKAPRFTGQTLADRLRARGLPLNHRFIGLPSSCLAAAGNFTGVIYDLRQQLTRHNYRQVQVKGAIGLAISGWAQDRVVKPTHRNAELAIENAIKPHVANEINQANAVIAGLSPNPSALQLATVAQQVYNLVQPFYNQLAIAAAAHDTLLPAGEGYKTSM